MPKLLEECGIDDDKLTLYSMRRTYHDAMDDAELSAEQQRVLVGHAAPDVHETYKRGKMRKLAEAVARIDVFAD